MMFCCCLSRNLQLDDLYLYMEDIKRSAPPVPFFIGGQSMGALVAAAAVVRSQDTWAGLILHSAAL
jgi:alpha-beta hydrolase superfamily lysophospholipase